MKKYLFALCLLPSLVFGGTWEAVKLSNGGFMQRQWTGQGWLVKWNDYNNNGTVIALTFVPDPRHEWV